MEFKAYFMKDVSDKKMGICCLLVYSAHHKRLEQVQHFTSSLLNGCGISVQH